LAGGRVSATADDVVQVRRLPNAVFNGDRIVLTMDPSVSASVPQAVECTVGEVGGGWVRCASPDDQFRPKREQVWYDLSRVVMVKKVEK